MSGGVTTGHLAFGAMADTRARNFLLAILLATVLPAILFQSTVLHVATDNATGRLTYVAAWMVANAHVALTGYFWFDTGYRDHIRQHRGYYYALPAAIVAACLLLVTELGDTGFDLFGIVVIAWNHHHFGRQNWGLLCLTASATATERPGRAAFRMNEAAAVAGILGILGGVGLLQRIGIAGWLHDAGLVLAIAVAGLSLVAASRQVLSGMPLMRPAMTAMTGLFFLPVFLDTATGVLAIAIAHSYQYVIIMGCLAAASRPKGVGYWLAPLVALTVIHTAIVIGIRLVDWGSWSHPVAVLALAVAIWHYLVDADVWRMARPFQRAAVRARLPYLFR